MRFTHLFTTIALIGVTSVSAATTLPPAVAAPYGSPAWREEVELRYGPDWESLYKSQTQPNALEKSNTLARDNVVPRARSATTTSIAAAVTSA